MRGGRLVCRLWLLLRRLLLHRRAAAASAATSDKGRSQHERDAAQKESTKLVMKMAGVFKDEDSDRFPYSLFFFYTYCPPFCTLAGAKPSLSFSHVSGGGKHSIFEGLRRHSARSL